MVWVKLMDPDADAIFLNQGFGHQTLDGDTLLDVQAGDVTAVGLVAFVPKAWAIAVGATLTGP